MTPPEQELPISETPGLPSRFPLERPFGSGGHLVRAGGRIRRLGWRIRLLVILKNTSNFAQKSLFLLCRRLVVWIVCRRLRLRISQAKNLGKDPVNSIALIASAGGLGAHDECRTISL